MTGARASISRGAGSASSVSARRHVRADGQCRGHMCSVERLCTVGLRPPARSPAAGTATLQHATRSLKRFNSLTRDKHHLAAIA
jgi:hypothetical protein